MLSGGANHPNAPSDHPRWACQDVTKYTPCPIHGDMEVYTCESCDDYSTTCLKCFEYHMRTGGGDHPNAPQFHRLWECLDLDDYEPCPVHYREKSSIADPKIDD
jgi:hypothetical protein